MTCRFTKNVTLPQVFSCILLVQFIYISSPEVETLYKLIPAGTKCRNNKKQPELAIKNTINPLQLFVEKRQFFNQNNQ